MRKELARLQRKRQDVVSPDRSVDLPVNHKANTPDLFRYR